MNASVLGVETSFQIRVFIFSGYITKNGIAGSYMVVLLFITLITQ